MLQQTDKDPDLCHLQGNKIKYSKYITTIPHQHHSQGTTMDLPIQVTMATHNLDLMAHHLNLVNMDLHLLLVTMVMSFNYFVKFSTVYQILAAYTVHL